LYYTEAHSGLSLVETPTGNIDVISLMRGQRAYWIATSALQQQKPKKLILADWSACHWSLRRLAQMQSMLSQFIKDGFSLYIWQNGRVLPLVFEELHSLTEKRYDITAEYTDRIIEIAAADQRLPRKQIHVLDNCWLRRFLENSGFSEKGDLLLSELMEENRARSFLTAHVKSLIAIGKKAHPPLAHIVHDVFSDTGNQFLFNLIEEFKELPIVRMYRGLEIKGSEVKPFTSSEKLKIGNFDFQLAEMVDIKSLSIERGEVDAADLKILLNRAPRLERLSLYDCVVKSAEMSIDLEEFLYLRELSLNASKWSNPDLLKALSSMPNLRRLDMSGYGSSLKELIIPKDSLLKLRVLLLRNVPTLSISALQSFLLAAPNITALDLDPFEDTEDELFTIEKDSLRLESLILHSSRMKIANLKRLFAACAQSLKTVNLNGYTGLTDEFTVESLPNLEKLYASCDITPAILSNILTVAPKLEYLYITSELLFHGLTLDGLVLKLKRLKISSQRAIIASDLQAFLASAVFLEELICKVEGDFSLPANSLSFLHGLQINSGSRLTSSSVKNFLEAAQHLESLSIINSTIECSAAESYSFPELFELLYIDFSETVFPSKFIQALLNKTPNIVSVVLNQSLAEDFSLVKNSLLQLEELSLKHALITINQVQTFLEAAPNIDTLILTDCKSLSGLLTLRPDSLPCLKVINLEGSGITAENLKILLKAAPCIEKITLKNTLALVLDPELRRLLAAFEFEVEDDHLSDVLPTPAEIVPSPAAVSVSVSVTPADVRHDYREASAYAPALDDKPFTFVNRQFDKSQKMIIEKFSQYLVLKGEDLALIPHISKGICNPLAQFFISSSALEWDVFLTMILAWDGKNETLTAELNGYFSQLLGYVRPWLSSVRKDEHYLGDHLSSFLEGCTTPCILSNPWHSIALRPKANGLWDLYDPNFKNGCREVSKSDLEAAIHTSIGHIISTETHDFGGTIKIDDPMAFVEQGGLLALGYCHEVEKILTRLSQVEDYSKDALEGLLLRDTAGLPAWALIIKAPLLANYAALLIKQFISKNPTNYLERLQRSIEYLRAEEKQKYIGCISSLFTSATGRDLGVRDVVTAVFRTAPLAPNLYIRQLQTWRTTLSADETISSYGRNLVEKGMKKQLIQLRGKRSVDGLIYAIQLHAQSKHQPLFYINSPDDLICSAPFVKPSADGSGILCRGPGGPLHQFLSAHAAGVSPLLIVNYRNFSPEDIVRFNSMLDKKRMIDGVAVPQDAMIIGVMDLSQPDCYREADFYSRFDEVKECLLAPDKCGALLPSLPIIDKSSVPSASIRVINLYQASDWRQRLIGAWTLDERGQLVFKKGALADLGEGSLELQNAPWDDEDFQLFWRQALLNGAVAGVTIPKNLKLIRSDGYDWALWKPLLTIEQGIAPGMPILNPSCLGDFFARYECRDHALTAKPGFIKAAERSLTVNLTRSLNENEWALLLSECKKYSVELKVCCVPDVKIPEVLLPSASTEEFPSLILSSHIARHTCVIKSNDIDTTVACFSKEAIIIDVSECNASSLLRRIDAKFIEDETPYFSFNENQAALITALALGKKVILKGHFSNELADMLAPFMLERRNKEDSTGTLIVIPENPEVFNYFPVQCHKFNSIEKLALLGALDERLSSHLRPTESLSQLKARRNYMIAHPSASSSDGAWCGLHHLSVTKPAEAWDASTSAADTAHFIKERVATVNKVLSYAPYVFLTGLSGVGKTTFVKEDFIAATDTLYVGEEKLKDWALDQSPKRKILLIDEANLSKKQWSEFEGLFNVPPSILIDGVLYELTPNHKVIFAGNPISYGEERALAPFFARHGNAMQFNPLPFAFIYEKSLKPVFAGTPLEAFAVPISQRILNVYKFLCEISTSDVLISPRELQMIALLISSYQKSHPAVDLNLITANMIYALTEHLVPNDHQIEFERLFKPSAFLAVETSSISSADFFVMPSRHRVKQYIEDYLALRELRQTSSGNDAQQYGGLGGIILEGEAGIGKSELVLAILKARGYKEASAVDHVGDRSKLFYQLPASMPVAEKEALLLKAFDEGAVVIMDEANSTLRMERLLNDLLMGKTPKNARPTRPGFTLICTQNPIYYAGRGQGSTALHRRMSTFKLAPYSSEEMQAILVAQGLSTREANDLVGAYVIQAAFAKENHLSPKPTFRDVLRIAKRIIGARELPTPVPTLMAADSAIFAAKKATCEALLREIESMRFGREDTQMNFFIHYQKQILREVNHTSIEPLLKELRLIRNNLCGDGVRKTQVQELASIISTYRQRAAHLFSRGMRAKAHRLEEAMQSVPVLERQNILTAHSIYARTLLEVLASHRYGIAHRTHRRDGTLDTEHAAGVYKEFASKFRSM
jgi:hypothetical protein